METVRFIFGTSIQRPSRIAKFSLATTASVATPAPARVAAGHSCKIRPQTAGRLKATLLRCRERPTLVRVRQRLARRRQSPGAASLSSKVQIPTSKARQNLNLKLQKMSAAKDIFAVFSLGIWAWELPRNI